MISCRACDYYLGEISWMRKRNNNYFVPQQRLNERTEIQRFDPPWLIKEIQVEGRKSIRLNLIFISF